MRTYKLTLEVFDDGKPVLNLHADESVMSSEHAKKVVDIIFDDMKVIKHEANNE